MSELPIVERAKYTAWDRLRELAFVMLLPLLVFGSVILYPALADVFDQGLAEGVVTLFWPSPDSPDAVGYFRSFRITALIFFGFGMVVYYFLRILFKPDETWTLSADNIRRERRYLVGKSCKTWGVGQILSVRLRTELLDVIKEERFILELTLRSGEVLRLPSKRLLTSAQRIKADIEAAAGIG